MPNINCTEFSRLLAEAVESHQSVASAALREHATQCADCRVSWLDALLVDRAVAQWKSGVPTADLADTVLFRLAAQEPAISVPTSPSFAGPLLTTSPSKTRRLVTRRTLVTLTASTAVICVAILVMRPGRPSQSPESSVVTVQPLKHQSVARQSEIAKSESQRLPTNEPATSLADSKPGGRRAAAKSTGNDARVDSLVRDAGSAYFNLASEAADAVTAVTVLVPPPDSSDAPLNADVNEERWVDEVQRELAPVTRQLGQAFEFLIQAVPAEKTPAT